MDIQGLAYTYRHMENTGLQRLTHLLMISVGGLFFARHSLRSKQGGTVSGPVAL